MRVERLSSPKLHGIDLAIRRVEYPLRIGRVDRCRPLMQDRDGGLRRHALDARAQHRLRVVEVRLVHDDVEVAVGPARPAASVRSLSGEAVGGDGTIFGMSPLVAIGLAVGGFFLFRSTGGATNV